MKKTSTFFAVREEKSEKGTSERKAKEEKYSRRGDEERG